MLLLPFSVRGFAGWGVVRTTQSGKSRRIFHRLSRRTGKSFPRCKEVRFLAPCKPRRYRRGRAELRTISRSSDARESPRSRFLFLKAPSALIGPEEAIRIPRGVSPVDYEAELAVVISKKGRHIPGRRRWVVCSRRYLHERCDGALLQKKDGQWARAKSYDTFRRRRALDRRRIATNDLRVEAYLNGNVVQQGSTREMIFSVPRLIAYISGVMTLEPGDIIRPEPEGRGAFEAGDVIEVFVEGVGN